LHPAVRLTFLAGEVAHRKLDLVTGLAGFAAHLRSGPPACLISCGNHMNWVCAAAATLADRSHCRVVLKATNPIIRPSDGPLGAVVRRGVYGWAVDAADRMLTLTEADAGNLSAAFPRQAHKFKAVANPYVTAEMLKPRTSDDTGLRTPIVVAVAGFSRRKRLDLLVEAFALTRTRDARLVLIGDGVERRAIEAQIQARGIGDRVDLAGYVADVGPWFARASVMALTSTYEGLPAVLFEAMAANCPVVSTNCFAGADELVGRSEGCLLSADDPASIAAALDQVLSQPRPTTLRTQAQRYSVEQGVRSHIAAVEDLLT
jgi:glycosyltransferase involved in cell wall biosynthesis